MDIVQNQIIETSDKILEETINLDEEYLNNTQFYKDIDLTKDSSEEKEIFYTKETTEALQEQFKDLDKMLKIIVKMFKYINKKYIKKIHEKTEEEILKELQDNKDNLNFSSLNVNNVTSNILEEFTTLESTMQKKIDTFTAFCDFAYNYYIKTHDVDVDFHPLPYTVEKFDLIMAYYHPNCEVAEDLRQIIENKFMKQLRKQGAPFLFITEMSISEVQEKFDNLVVPLAKNILNNLLKLKKS